MDGSEQLALAYLQSRGFSSVVYEPDGKVPPDFLCDGRIAVEVRRLNQSYETDAGTRGLEEWSIPIWYGLEKLLFSLKAPASKQSWFVFFSLDEPRPEWKALRTVVKHELKKFMNLPNPQPCRIPITRGFELEFMQSSEVFSEFFVMGGSSDFQEGGFIISEIAMNLKRCIEEKGAKISSVRSRYAEWWLVLPNYIGFGLNERDKSMLYEEVKISHSFDKIILLDPRDHKRAFAIAT